MANGVVGQTHGCLAHHQSATSETYPRLRILSRWSTDCGSFLFIVLMFRICILPTFVCLACVCYFVYLSLYSVYEEYYLVFYFIHLFFIFFFLSSRRVAVNDSSLSRCAPHRRVTKSEDACLDEHRHLERGNAYVSSRVKVEENACAYHH